MISNGIVASSLLLSTFIGVAISDEIYFWDRVTPLSSDLSPSLHVALIEISVLIFHLLYMFAAIYFVPKTTGFLRNGKRKEVL